MSIDTLIAIIDAEIARFEQARTLLAGSQDDLALRMRIP
jgi:hypothetical protein